MAIAPFLYFPAKHRLHCNVGTMSITSTAATIFLEEVEKTVGKKKLAVDKKKVAVDKKVFTPLLHKGVKSFLCAQRNDFSFIGSAYKKLNNAERCCRKNLFYHFKDDFHFLTFLRTKGSFSCSASLLKTIEAKGPKLALFKT